jgi:hypothetical protein
LRFTSPMKRFVASFAVATVGSLVALSATAAAQTGGAAPPVDPAAPVTPPVVGVTSGIPFKAKVLPSGIALPPPNAPPAVVNTIAAGNAIRTRPYIFGGGHKNFFSLGYDCSGAVSFALHGGGLLASPLPSGSLARWGLPGRGAWITVFANGGHAYMVVAGLRFDTSAVGEKLTQGSGPRWRATKRSPKGYVPRHFTGL